ncbi:MAG: tyrosine-type recombinase/integrase [Deltaproteobacteria bacterium]|nr:tyrosine-type recombinase/integrase [Deltaproteobacteria bacterium]
MEKKGNGSTNQAPIEQLVEEVLGRLKELDYAEKSLRTYRSTFNGFVDFCHNTLGEKHYSLEVVDRYLQHHQVPLHSPSRLSWTKRNVKTAMRILSEYAMHGCFQIRCASTERIKLPPQMKEILENYERFCAERCGIRQSTIRNRRVRLKCFLHYIDSHGITHLKDIKPYVFSGYMRSQSHFKPETLSLHGECLRSFMRYLNMEGILSEDLSPQVPRVKIWKHGRIPSIWKPEEVEQLFAVVDRASPVGKRDYAILLLAVRLGMRAGDIRTLRFENLNWDESRIEITQSKTGEPLVLPLMEEVGSALIDYLRHARPESEYREVFLRAHAPYKPFADSASLSQIVVRYRRRAGIRPKQERLGMHSLRHTLATRLLEAGTPLDTIADVMGHLSLDSTRVYTKVDIEMLRTAALDIVEEGHHA